MTFVGPNGAWAIAIFGVMLGVVSLDHGVAHYVNVERGHYCPPWGFLSSDR